MHGSTPGNERFWPRLPSAPSPAAQVGKVHSGVLEQAMPVQAGHPVKAAVAIAT